MFSIFIYLFFLDDFFFCAFNTADVTIGAFVGKDETTGFAAAAAAVSSATSTISNFARVPNRVRTKKRCK